MAEQNKPHDPHDPKGKEQADKHFDMNLELPQHRVPDESEIDFNDVEDVEVVDAAEISDVHPADEPKSGKVPTAGPPSDVNLLMDDVVEDVVEVVDVGETAESGPKTPPPATHMGRTGKGHTTQLAGKGGVPTMVAGEHLPKQTGEAPEAASAEAPPVHGEAAAPGSGVDIGHDEIIEAAAVSDSNLDLPLKPDPKQPVETGSGIDIGSEEVLDVVEVLPSSGKVAEPLVSGDESGSDVLKSDSLPSATGEQQPPRSDTPSGDVIVDYEEDLVEGGSEIDIGQRGTGKAERLSGVDIIAEALESGVDLEQAKSETPPHAKKQPVDESDIDFQSVLDEPESSAIDFGSGQSPSLPASTPSSHRRRADDSGRAEAPEDQESLDVVGEEALHAAAETELDDEDEILVTPKKKTGVVPEEKDESGFDVRESALSHLEEPSLEDQESFETAPQPVAARGADDELAVEEAPAPRRRAAAAAAGGTATLAKPRQRSAVMPFLLGAILAVVLVGGAAGAVWFLAPGMIPESPNAEKKPATGGGAAQQIVQNVQQGSTAQKAREKIDEGKYDEALDLVKDAKEGNELAMLGLAALLKLEAESKEPLKGDNENVEKALKQLDEGGAKTLAADYRKKFQLQEQLSQQASQAVAAKSQAEARAKNAEGLKTVLTELNVPQQADQLKAFLAESQKAKQASASTIQALQSAKVLPDKATPEQVASAIGELVKSRDNLTQTITKVNDTLTRVNEAVAKAGIKNADVGKAVEELNTTRLEAVKERDTLNVAIDAALKELKEGNYLGNDPDRIKLLVEGTRKARLAGQSPLASSLGAMVGSFGGLARNPGDVFKKLFDNAKMAADLKLAQAQLALAESPDNRLDTMLILLGDRNWKDVKDLTAFKNYVELLRSKESKASPEARAKALYAAALIQRNQGDYASARKTTEEALNEAQALKGNPALQTAAAQTLKELNDPAGFFLPRVERQVADSHYKDAVEEVTAALKALPDNARLRLKRAEIQLQAASAQSKVDEATQKTIREDAEAARKDPKAAAESYYFLGKLDELTSNWSKAEENYRQALKLAAGADEAERYSIALARVLVRERSVTGVQGGGTEEPEPEGMQDDEVADAAECAAQVPGGDDEATAAKRLQESIDLATQLIKSANPKTRGEGYMILGAAQARQGKKTEGLKNFAKGLELVYPGMATHDLTQMIETHPAFSQPDIALQANPLMAERHFGKGLDFFWSKKYADAEEEFKKAIGLYDQDARYRYFLGMSRYLQNTAEKRKLAEFDFEQGVRLELARRPGPRDINATLERVQGDMRRVLNSYREKTS